MMFIAIGVILFFVSATTIVTIVFTTARTCKLKSEITISKKNLIYLFPTLLLIYFLHMTAWKFNGGDLDFFTCFTLLGSALEVIMKFKVDTSVVLPICQAYPIFYVDFVFAYLAGGAAVILSVSSFFSQRIANWFSVRKRIKNNCDVIIGECEDSLTYIKNNADTVYLIENVSRQKYIDLLKMRAKILKGTLSSVGKKLKKGEHNIIVFRQENISYGKIIDDFIALRRKNLNLSLYLQANAEEVKFIKSKFVSKADKEVSASINCFSKHDLIARQFVSEYPLTKYIPEEFYNENRTLKSGYDINVVFAGFGKINCQLFKMAAMQFQFAEQDGDKLRAKMVHYYVYDNREEALHNEFFSQLLYEFDEEFEDCDFPKPEKICDLTVNRCDINSVEAKAFFRKIVNEKTFTYFVVSLKTDLEDAAYAASLKRLLEKQKNYKIFVRAKNSAEKLNSAEDDIIYFGEDDVLYRRDSIVNDDLFELAQRINVLYNDVNNSPEWLQKIKSLPLKEQNKALTLSLKDPACRKLMREQWEERPMIEQASNLYHALNLPFKLNMLGLEMVKADASDAEGITEEEFDSVYVNKGREKNYSDVSDFFGTDSANVLAFIEHSRWNALYLIYDYRQMKKKDMTLSVNEKSDGTKVKTVNHKNTETKEHGCLTTYYGLRDLINYKFSLMYPDENSEEVSPTDERLVELYKIYRYDYMDLDRTYKEITSLGYKLLQRKVK